MFHPYLWVRDYTLATLGMLMGHFVQYLAIVWLLHHRKYGSLHTGSPAQRLLSRVSARYVLIGAFIAVSGLFFIAANHTTAAIGMPSVYTVSWFAFTFIHFYLDGLHLGVPPALRPRVGGQLPHAGQPGDRMSAPAAPRRVAVVGGGGFIGRHLVARCRRAARRCGWWDSPAPAPPARSSGRPATCAIPPDSRRRVRRTGAGVQSGRRTWTQYPRARGLPRGQRRGRPERLRGRHPLRGAAPGLHEYGRRLRAGTVLRRVDAHRDRWPSTAAPRSPRKRSTGTGLERVRTVRSSSCGRPSSSGPAARARRTASSVTSPGPISPTTARPPTAGPWPMSRTSPSFSPLSPTSADGVRLFNYADVPDLTVAEIVSIVRGALGLAPAPRRSLAGAYATTSGLRSGPGWSVGHDRRHPPCGA